MYSGFVRLSEYIESVVAAVGSEFTFLLFLILKYPVIPVGVMYCVGQYPAEFDASMGFEFLCMNFVIIAFLCSLIYFNVYVKVLIKYFSECCLMEKFARNLFFSSPFDLDREGEAELDCLENPKHLHNSNLQNLPDDLLSLIFGKLCFMNTKVYFGVVCHSFYSVFKEDAKQPCCPLPLLMVTTPDNTATHSFYNTFDDSNLFGNVPLDHSTFCRGTRHGWLVTVKEDLAMSLFNPFLSQDGYKIQLPPLTTFEWAPFDDDTVRYYNTVVKAAISADPLSTPEDCVVTVIYGVFRRVAFCRPGDKSWTTLTSQVTNLEDVIYYRGKFHVMDLGGQVFACDLNPDADSKLTRIAPVLRTRSSKRYIVELESTGDLMQITRNTIYDEYITLEEESIAELIRNARPVGITEDCPFTIGFKVFKMDADSGHWIEVHNLQGCSFFIGDNTSLSVYMPAANSVGYGCNKPNTIWFTDDEYERQEIMREAGCGPDDVGVFDLDDGTIKPIYPMKVEFIAPPPIWIQPILG